LTSTNQKQFFLHLAYGLSKMIIFYRYTRVGVNLLLRERTHAYPLSVRIRVINGGAPENIIKDRGNYESDFRRN